MQAMPPTPQQLAEAIRRINEALTPWREQTLARYEENMRRVTEALRKMSPPGR